MNRSNWNCPLRHNRARDTPNIERECPMAKRIDWLYDRKT